MLATKIKQIDKSYYQSLLQKIESNSPFVGVIGMGYVGLPNMIYYAKRGCSVIGFDIDESKVKMVNQGRSYIDDVKSAEVKNLVDEKVLASSSNFNHLEMVDIVLICVPTPIDKEDQPDLSFIKNAVSNVIENISKGTLVVLESTTCPFTTENLVAKEIESKGFIIGEDVFVAYSPERIDPLNNAYNIDNTPRIVSGYTNRCIELINSFIGENAVKVSSTVVAELSKLYENTFRYVNIALANELALLCDKMNIDVWEVIEASETKPYGFMSFYPTTKIGGHCIPIDPHYLSWSAKGIGFDIQMIKSAEKINNKMEKHSLGKIIQILDKAGVPIEKSRIAILGATYKKDISDTRESPVLGLYDSLKSMQADIKVFDPNVGEITLENGKVVDIEDIDYDNLSKYDLIVLLVDHSEFDYQKIADNSKVIFDTKNIMPKYSTSSKCYSL